MVQNCAQSLNQVSYLLSNVCLHTALTCIPLLHVFMPGLNTKVTNLLHISLVQMLNMSFHLYIGLYVRKLAHRNSSVGQ